MLCLRDGYRPDHAIRPLTERRDGICTLYKLGGVTTRCFRLFLIKERFRGREARCRVGAITNEDRVLNKACGSARINSEHSCGTTVYA